MSANAVLIADTHVHLYPCYDVALALRAAARRFAQVAATLPIETVVVRALCFSERAEERFFSTAYEQGELVIGPFTFRREGALLRCSEVGGESILIVPGRQIRTAEGLELLGLAVAGEFADGLRIEQQIDEVHARGGVPVLPWSFGKWWGRRGRILRQVLERQDPGRVLLGDIPLRSSWGPLLGGGAERFHTIAGSDPLPFRGEERQLARLLTVFELPEAAIGDKDIPYIIRSSRGRVVGHRNSPLEAAVRLAKLRIG